MLDYTEIAATALASIQEAGRQAVIKRLLRVLDPVAGTVSISLESSGILDMVVLPVTESDPLDDRLKEALIAGKLRKLLVAASTTSFPPKALDIVLFDGLYWLVHGSTALRPSTVAVLYTLIVENTDLGSEDITALDLTALERAIADLGAFIDP